MSALTLNKYNIYLVFLIQPLGTTHQIQQLSQQPSAQASVLHMRQVNITSYATSSSVGQIITYVILILGHKWDAISSPTSSWLRCFSGFTPL